MAQRVGLGLGVLPRGLGVPPPAALSWPDAYDPRARFIDGAWQAQLDPRDVVAGPFGASATEYWVDVTAGNDANDGLTSATPKRAIHAAITAGNATGAPFRVNIKAGDYYQGQTINGSSGLTGVEPTQPCALIGYSGRVRHLAGTVETFPSTKDATYTNSYVGGPSSASRLFDRSTLTANGDYTELTHITTGTDAERAATVDATPGSWCVSAATGSSKTHVRRTDDAQPTLANTAIYRNIHVAALDTCTSDLYFEGFDFEGGPRGALWCDPISTRNVVCVDCTFKYAGTSTNMLDGLRIRQVNGLVYLKDCVASSNWKDGFNFHRDGGTAGAMYVLTSGCEAYDNGKTGSSSNNGYTLHDDITAIDVGGNYHDTLNGADVHNIETTKAWFLGLVAEMSQVTDATAAAVKITAPSVAWLQDATLNSVGDAIRAQGSGATVYKRRVDVQSGTETADSGSTITTY